VRRQPKIGTFGGVALFLIATWSLLELAYPTVAGWIASSEWGSIREGLPSSGAEVPLFLTLAAAAAFAWASYSETRWREFLAPLRAFARWRSPWKPMLLLVLPVLGGGRVIVDAARGPAEPVARPILHPTPPEAFSQMRNPLRAPTDAMLDAFDDDLRSGAIDAARTTEPAVRAYAAALAAGDATEEARREAFLRRAIEEGRDLYQTACRPCHGSSARGNGPLAFAQRRVPLDFTGVETIATLVEGAAFWRIQEGGIGLPREGAPWESAMPRWGDDLDETSMWKILMAEYDLAGNRPREPEVLH